jgi:hypothetical protein
MPLSNRWHDGAVNPWQGNSISSLQRTAKSVTPFACAKAAPLFLPLNSGVTVSSLEQASKQLTAVYDDYFSLSDALRADGERILDDPRSDQTWRRNLIRVTWPMLEAYASILRAMCKVYREYYEIRLTQKQERLLEDESQLASADRLKETLKLAFRLHELEDSPSFGDADWSSVRKAIAVRDRITHPKSSIDLEIADDEWESVHGGLTWALQCFTSFFDQTNTRYGHDT